MAALCYTRLVGAAPRLWKDVRMSEPTWPRLDKTKLVVTSLFDDSDEKQYWLSRSPEERWAAMELMRQMVYGYDPATTRLQRILEITQRQAG